MKSVIWILTVGLAASAWAQTPAAKPQSAAQLKPGAAPVAMASAAKPLMPAPAAAKPQKLQPAKPSAAASATAAARQQAPESKAPAPILSAAKTTPGRKGHRDPFVSPIVERAPNGAACTGTGKRCLYVGDLSLLGIVLSQEGVIAVVASGDHTYFLREHDPLADGDVEKITRNAITMRQRSSDLLGRPQMREVTRKLGGPAV